MSMHGSGVLVVDLGSIIFAGPTALVAVALLAIAGEFRRMISWIASLLLGMGLIFLGKVAFDFGGFYFPAIGFYSISGHAMLAMAVFPALGAIAFAYGGRRLVSVGFLVGFLLATSVIYQLIAGTFHTTSETLVGGSVGLIVAVSNAWGVPMLVADWRRLGDSAALFFTLACVGVGILASSAMLKSTLWRETAALPYFPYLYQRIIMKDPNSGAISVEVLQRRLHR